MRYTSFAGSLVATTALMANIAHADLASCARIVADSQRLACYDALAEPQAGGSASPPAAAIPRTADVATSAATVPATGTATATAAAAAAAAVTPRAETTADSEAARLRALWELDPYAQGGTFRLLPHRPLYALLHATSRVNSNPQSPTRTSDSASLIELQHVDTKLQLSFKTKLAQDILGSASDLWFGYTQQSY
ncbi:MAG: phospholipase A, partial [Casimicrobiaceae bacterium]